MCGNVQNIQTVLGNANAPSDPCFLLRPIEFLGFCGSSELGEGEGGEGNWAGPHPLFISGFSLIGMALACAGPDNDEDAAGE